MTQSGAKNALLRALELATLLLLPWALAQLPTALCLPNQTGGLSAGPHHHHHHHHHHKTRPEIIIKSKVNAALAANPIPPQALPLGHPDPAGGAQVVLAREPPASGQHCRPLRGQRREPATRGEAGQGADASRLGASEGPPAGTETKPKPKTKSAARLPPNGFVINVMPPNMIDGSPEGTFRVDGGGDEAPTRRAKRAADGLNDSHADNHLADDGAGHDGPPTERGVPLQAAEAATSSELTVLSAHLDGGASSRGSRNGNLDQSRAGQVISLSSSSTNEDADDDDDDDEFPPNQHPKAARSAGSGMLDEAPNEAASPPAGKAPKLKCRVEKDLYLEFEEYQHYTCAHCYNQVPPEYFNNKLGLVRERGRMIRLVDRESEQPIWTNETARIKQTFKVEEKFEKWQICCRQAQECCLENAKYLPAGADRADDQQPLVDDPDRNECPGTWDGLACWPPSAAGRLAWRECPRVAYLLDFEPACRGYVTKQCFQNASWFINRNGHEWSDYSSCSPEGLYKARMLHASVAYVCEALIVVPALLIIGKFPNRGGNKRIRIMKSLLFYILLNSLIQALQRGFLAAGYFAEYRGGPHSARVEHHSSSRQQLHQSQQQQQQQQRQEQSAVPTKLALISSTEAGHMIGHNAGGQTGNDQLILRATSAASPDVRQLVAGSPATSSDHVEPRRSRHARSADLRKTSSTTTRAPLLQSARGEVDDDEHGNLDGADNENELVARIFSTTSRRRHSLPQLVPFQSSGLLDEPTSFRAQDDNSTDHLTTNLSRNGARADSWIGQTQRRAAAAKPADSSTHKIDATPTRRQLSPGGGDNALTLTSKYQVMSPTWPSESWQDERNKTSPLTHKQVPEKRILPGKQMTTTLLERFKRNSTASHEHKQVVQPQVGRTKRKESAWKAFFCWFLQMASRLVRLMSYAWMFTGGVYLCSALHFAPAEPPTKFIKILFFLTNAFPNLIFLAYVIARTINEPSPLNIIIKAPYYWYRGDNKEIEQLYDTQKVCWFEESKSQSIEDIADLPNLILVAANVFLFAITLIILCRINRPGSTRPDMSPCAYFKAAGTLLFLYGGHYFFLAYRPESESCSVDTFMFYAFICIDVVQGIAISIVFCYMTQEGKSVILKYWKNKHRYTPFRQFIWLSCFGDKYKLADNGYHHTPFTNVRLNHSTRSNTSACNGHNDNVTELVNINDTQVSGNF